MLWPLQLSQEELLSEAEINRRSQKQNDMLPAGSLVSPGFQNLTASSMLLSLPTS